MAQPLRTPKTATENTLVTLLCALAVRAGGAIRISQAELHIDGDFSVDSDNETGDLIVTFAQRPGATRH